jgi:hypothetical protein
MTAFVQMPSGRWRLPRGDLGVRGFNSLPALRCNRCAGPRAFLRNSENFFVV